VADDQTSDKVSREAHDRMTRERDELKAKLDEVSTALTDMALREKTRSALKGKVADPDIAADFFLPHLRGTEVDKIGETLGSERFTQMMSLMAASPPAASSDDGDPSAEPPLNPGPQSSFAGPNPGATGGAAPEPKKVNPRDVRHLRPDQLADLDAKGLVDWSEPNSDGGFSISNRLRAPSA